jgi:uncharacterized membrane protein (UPF0127 family)
MIDPQMKIYNQTRQTTLTDKIIVPTAYLDQSLGLLKHKTPVAMLLKTHFGVHTFFMKYPIDVIILDETNHVAALKENLKPNQIYLWNPKHETVLELPTETLKKTKTQLGDRIEIK